ncbi:unnamed protein product (mitochondrion) [Plasmodiophora brassicae]|uniref:Uncharacterized protein n=1 Tax=Plasmodiophora brassicae TaxID=37360 RepID=A0A3P3YD07_PLABS|nr:unnamed protein product [Plasmodiophora brassicae]
MADKAPDALQIDATGVVVDLPADAARDGSHVMPLASASIASRVTYAWIGDLLRLGAKRPLEIDDVYRMDDAHSSKHLSAHFGAAWQREHEHAAAATPPRQASILRAMFAAFGPTWLPAGILKVFSDLSTILTPLVLSLLLREMGKQSYLRLCGLCVLMFAMQEGSTFFVNYYFQLTMNVGFDLRTSLTTEIYEKSLRLSSSARQQFSSGQAVNMVSTDTTRIEMLSGYLHYTWSGLFQIVLILALLLTTLGWPSLVGVGLLLVALPVQAGVMRYLSKLRKETSGITDRRVKLMQEILNGIRVIKFYSWEPSFLAHLFGLRSAEMHRIKRIAYFRAGFMMISGAIPLFASIVSFVVYNLVGNPLTADVIFPCVAYFNLLRFPLMMLPMILGQIVDASVAVKRIQAYLLAQELSYRPAINPSSPDAISITSANFLWETAPAAPSPPANGKAAVADKDRGPSSGFRIRDINLHVPVGKLVCVVGPVGSGKTSLLSAMVAEMSHESGSIEFNGSVGYCPQQAWIQNTSLRDNVLFGQAYDAATYLRTIEDCCLIPDIEALPDGDRTEIGEKGITLSGGQKQRVNLARAVYFDPDIILLDDPLSAVDAMVGKALFDQCLMQRLAGKTRVLVTHQLHFVPRADYIVVMDAGRIAEQGTYADLMNANGEFTRLMHEYGGVSSRRASDASSSAPPADGPAAAPPAKPQADVGRGDPTRLKTQQAPGAKLMTSEERAMGAVDSRYYLVYLKQCGGVVYIVALFLTLAASQVANVGVNTWLAVWIADPNANKNAMDIYVLLGAASAVLTLVFGAVNAYGSTRGAIRIHMGAIQRVMRAPVSFFETTPMGRILNRFSKDQDGVDSLLPQSLSSFLQTAASCIATFILICVVTPPFIAILLPLLVVYYYVQRFYRSTSRELKRLDALMRSPLYAQFSETLNGLATIRAYREEVAFVGRHRALLDADNRPQFCQIAIQRWLSLRLETIGNLMVLAASLSCVLMSVSSSLTGLTISYALTVTSVMNWCVRQAADTEIQMNSVERLDYYANGLPIEEPADAADVAVVRAMRPPKSAVVDVVDPRASWPETGTIVFDKFTLRYRPELPPVLNDISLSIRSCEKIGVVGRTGAGKSSLMIALFRIVEAASGRILIDDVETRTVGLRRLRQSLAIIPQDPILFSGTVRHNLDPFDEFDDDKVWAALRGAFMAEYIDAQGGKLNALVAEQGENFSVGQKQLLCLARALLRERARIVILDEATASIDLSTDALLQRALRVAFRDRTLLTIAHRLNTVIDYNRVLVLDKGRVAEFDTPAALLARDDSILSSLVNETGPTNAALLRRIASGAVSYEDALNASTS